MSRALRPYRSHRSTRLFGRRVPTRVLAATVGTVLVLLNALLVLGPVLSLTAAVAPASAALGVPGAGAVVLVVLGFVVAGVCVLGAYFARRKAITWTLVVLAWVISLVASLWPLIAGADATVDRARDVLPWLTTLVHSLPRFRST